MGQTNSKAMVQAVQDVLTMTLAQNRNESGSEIVDWKEVRKRVSDTLISQDLPVDEKSIDNSVRKAKQSLNPSKRSSLFQLFKGEEKVKKILQGLNIINFDGADNQWQTFSFFLEQCKKKHMKLLIKEAVLYVGISGLLSASFITSAFYSSSGFLGAIGGISFLCFILFGGICIFEANRVVNYYKEIKEKSLRALIKGRGSMDEFAFYTFWLIAYDLELNDKLAGEVDFEKALKKIREEHLKINGMTWDEMEAMILNSRHSAIEIDPVKLVELFNYQNKLSPQVRQQLKSIVQDWVKNEDSVEVLHYHVLFASLLSLNRMLGMLSKNESGVEHARREKALNLLS